MKFGLAFYIVLLLLELSFPLQAKISIRCVDEPLECVTTDGGPHSQTSILQFITYYTDHIIDHAQYALAINAKYATFHNSSFRIYSPRTGHEYDINDQRWNKVKILYELMVSCASEENNNRYVIWLDADLIIVNFAFDFFSITNRFPNADIIISREINPKNGLANTGTLIMKCTPWSKQFTNKWWNEFDRSAGMDQHAFEQLYYLADYAEHIVLLPENMINSKFPGLTTFQDQEPILHAAGESNFIRAHVFQLAWKVLCEHLHHQEIASHHSFPMLMARHTLDNIDYVALHAVEWKSILSRVSREFVKLHCHHSPLLLQQIRYQIREAQQSLAKFVCTKDEAVEDGDRDYHNLVGQCRDLKQLFHSDRAIALQQVHVLYSQLFHQCYPASESVSILQGVLDSALDYLIVLNNTDEDILRVIRPLPDVIQALQSLIHPSQWKILHYYDFKLQEMLGLYYLFTQQTVLASASFQKAFVVWQTMVEEYGYFGDGNGLMNSFEEGLCVLKRYLFLQCWQVQSRSYASEEMSFYVQQLIKYSLEAYRLHLNREITLETLSDVVKYTTTTLSSAEEEEEEVLPVSMIADLMEVILLVGKCQPSPAISEDMHFLLRSLCLAKASSECYIVRDGSELNISERLLSYMTILTARSYDVSFLFIQFNNITPQIRLRKIKKKQ